jgi:hypothetical protein
MSCLAAAHTRLPVGDFEAVESQWMGAQKAPVLHTLYMDTPSPSSPTAISVRLRFFMPLILHTLAACMRPLVEPTGFDSVARVKGAPIRSEDDMVVARPARGGSSRSALGRCRYARNVRGAGYEKDLEMGQKKAVTNARALSAAIASRVAARWGGHGERYDTALTRFSCSDPVFLCSRMPIVTCLGIYNALVAVDAVDGSCRGPTRNE